MDQVYFSGQEVTLNLRVGVTFFLDNLGEIKKGGFFGSIFARAILFNMVFFGFSHESVSNLLFNSERIIQIDYCGEE